MIAPLKRRLAGLHADHRRIALGAARVAFFLLMGKAVGAVKEMAVAYRYGVSDAVDAYQFTLTIANWLPVTLVGACSVVLIPALVRSRAAVCFLSPALSPEPWALEPTYAV